MNLNHIYTWPTSFRVLLIISCGIGFFLLLYFFDISSLNSELEKTQQEELNLKEQLTTIVNKEILDKKQLVQFQPIETLLIEWQKKLINYSQLPQLMDQILKMGTANHIDFQLFSPASPVKENLYYKVPIKIIAVGTYNDLAKLISQIASLPSIAVINNFSITNELKSSGIDPKLAARIVSDQLLILEMTLEVYYVAKK